MRQVPPVATALFKLGVFGAGAYLSSPARCPYCFFPPIGVGVIFGFVVLVWHPRSLGKLIDLRAIAFLASSFLIWNLVFRLPYNLLPLPYHRLPSYLLLYEIVYKGTILLPIAQGWLLGASLRRALIAIPCILGIWLVGVWILSHTVFAGAVLDIGEGVRTKFSEEDAILASPPIWQGAYLLCMFGSVPQFLRTRFWLPRRPVAHAFFPYGKGMSES